MGSTAGADQIWKWVASAALAGCGLLAIALAFVVRLRSRSVPDMDERLIGTWHCDADRTVAEWRERRPITDEQAEVLRREIFEPGWVTFTHTDRTEEHKGSFSHDPYAVIGRDATSVVIRAPNPQTGDAELIHVHFADADMFWVHAEISPLRTYYRLIKSSTRPDSGA